MNVSSTGLHDRATDAALHESQVPGVLETGTLLFSSAPKLIYIDARAGELCARINLTLTGCATNVLPLPVTRLCADIAAAMTTKLRRSDYSPFELRRFSDGKDSSVLLRGYGLPYPAGSQEGRILVLLEDLGWRKELPLKEACRRFHFTEREAEVVRNLAKGYTNKQIGSELDATEQTIKEVIKRIMQKTRTATRTGILIAVLDL
ncbi:MAG: hypothetical protein OJF47_000272 [Nitrospira sp.]|jgi:DNA-binding CsgD family transcriptional regulator|nr:MAG: hypothetical protein OJF47_000272 [Nitrospira sp.]